MKAIWRLIPPISLIILAVFPTFAGGRILDLPTKIYVAPMVVRSKVISKADAVILTEILIENLPKYCWQIKSPNLMVSAPDSAAVTIYSTMIMSEVGRSKVSRYQITFIISDKDKTKIVREIFSGYGDPIYCFLQKVPHIIKNQIEPAIIDLFNP